MMSRRPGQSTNRQDSASKAMMKSEWNQRSRRMLLAMPQPRCATISTVYAPSEIPLQGNAKKRGIKAISHWW
jgi:hypothetical protein